MNEKKRNKTKAMHRFIVSKSIWNRMALQAETTSRKQKVSLLTAILIPKFISREQNQSEESERKYYPTFVHVTRKKRNNKREDEIML